MLVEGGFCESASLGGLEYLRERILLFLFMRRGIEGGFYGFAWEIL